METGAAPLWELQGVRGGIPAGCVRLILTNEYIYQPYFGAMNLECTVLYQERYGMGEPPT